MDIDARLALLYLAQCYSMAGNIMQVNLWQRLGNEWTSNLQKAINMEELTEIQCHSFLLNMALDSQLYMEDDNNKLKIANQLSFMYNKIDFQNEPFVMEGIGRIFLPVMALEKPELVSNWEEMLIMLLN